MLSGVADMSVVQRGGEGRDVPAPEYHEYRPWVVGGLIAVYVGAWLTALAWEPFAGAAAAILVAVIILTLVLDGSGVLTLRGRIWQERLPVAATGCIVLLFFPFLILWVIPYLIIAASDTQRASERQRLIQRQRIAQLERDLGFLPLSEGTCSSCQRPLQAGAEFCAYCGARVQAPPQVCPACHTATFPDALWCPNCGAALRGEL